MPEHQVTLSGLLNFEIRSLFGRLFLNSKPKLQNHSNKHFLHLGCGNLKLDDWINADFFTFRGNNKPDWMLDLRFPLNCDDNVWDGVFTEHTLEHLYPDQAQKLLQELYRTMKPGAWIRLTVPDLKKYVAYYTGDKVNEHFNLRGTGCEAIRSLTQNYFHISLYDNLLLENCLKKSGFVNIREVNFMEGVDISLLKDKEERAWETLYMEAQKSV
jgi:predicted SAM-dependent methyltransferase